MAIPFKLTQVNHLQVDNHKRIILGHFFSSILSEASNPGVYKYFKPWAVNAPTFCALNIGIPIYRPFKVLL